MMSAPSLLLRVDVLGDVKREESHRSALRNFLSFPLLLCVFDKLKSQAGL